ITLAARHRYPLHPGFPSTRRFCAINVLEELDLPGEYCVDPKAGRLYFWPAADPRNSQNPQAPRVVLGALPGPVVQITDASHVLLRGFVVEATMGNAIQVRGGQDVRIQACHVRNVRQAGVVVTGGEAHRVEACDIHDTGAGGVTLEGGDRKTLTPAGHQASNNHIWRYAIHKITYATAIEFKGVGNRADHNLIHDAPHMAVSVQGNDHLFEFNVVHDVCNKSDDAGALYKGRNPSCRGNIIRSNFWHHIGDIRGPGGLQGPRSQGTAAIYFDDGDGGDSVVGNVFYRCGEPNGTSFGTIFSHGGHDLVADNNIFIECKRALGSTPWNDARWKTALEGGGGCLWTKRLLEEVDITKPPYTTRYPALVGFMDFKPGQPRVSRAERNVFVDCDSVSSGNWRCDKKRNLTLKGDPGFVGGAKGDFRLKDDSSVFRSLPDFVPIPFEKIGLFADPLRPTPPVERWEEAPAGR
ncbi:MAG: right-handed parallel beta-helix repeat-containing protein, partial [Planctomycetota bacterium]|nr:right-handed parallel beta-helix repeat-containing protein [Planctomycetota bacterium]